MSGEKCFEVLEKIFLPKKFESIENIKGYTIKYGHIVENLQEYKNGEVLENAIVDEVLVSYFKAPKSYTTENMCEINTHGGNIVVRKILELCLKNGAEMAEPGEFTKRAFLNGRIDLLQAESVIDIIDAKSERELKAGMNQLEGQLSKKIHEIKQKIMDVMVNVEVDIDYPEYDVEEVTNAEIKGMLDIVISDLEKLEKSFDNGKILKDGVKTAIIGKPNAGKSSLLNCILNEERAIVTEIEGTTRDTLEESINLNGVFLNLIDTAGIRDSEDVVEQIGVNKAKELAEKSDLVIFVADASKELDENDKEIINLIKDKQAIVLLNKSDLGTIINEKNVSEFDNKPVITFSAKTGDGLDELENKIRDLFYEGKVKYNDELYITNARQKESLINAKNSIEEVIKSVENDMPEDFYSIDLMDAYTYLGQIIGESVEDDLVNEIFSKFCMGK